MAVQFIPDEGWGVRYSWEFLVGVYRPVLQILTLFQTKKCHFPKPEFSEQTSKIHTRFQTWPLRKNYVIVTQIRAHTKKLLQIHFDFACFSINTFINSRSSLEKTIPDSGCTEGVPPLPPAGSSFCFQRQLHVGPYSLRNLSYYSVNNKIRASCRKNLFPMRYIKHNKQQKGTLRNCQANKFSKSTPFQSS